MSKTIRRIFLEITPDYKPGDPRPTDKSDYLGWMAWAEAQHKAGIGQVRCARCRLYQFPQELAVTETDEGGPVCRECAA